MKNLKVNLKLIISFLIVIVLTVAVGVVGIVGMIQMESAGSEMYYRDVEPLPYLARASEMIQRARVSVREMVLAVVNNDRATINREIEEVRAYVALVEQDLASYSDRIVDEEVSRYFESGYSAFRQGLVPVVLAINEAALVDDMPRIQILLDDCRHYAELIVTNFERTLEVSILNTEESNEESSRLGNVLLIIIIASLVVAVAAALILALYISGLVSKPLALLTSFMKNAAITGELEANAEDAALIKKYSMYKDEIGECLAATDEFMHEINTEMDLLERVGDGDLSITPNILSEKDKVGKALTRVVDQLNAMFNEIKMATTQVSVGSKQIADGAQSLAQGSTEQAASVQQLSSSITEVAQKTKDNASMAERAAMLANDIKGSAEKGSQQMDEMMVAVKDINASSQNISKVIKSIDDIAFQTNILALNAAVEAARAGQHGKGFAVVAEEVRNLAAKSADSAKETEKLIADSIEKAELGSRIADETAASLAEIVTGIGESSQLVSEIAKSSDEQSSSISQINQGIDQVAQVTQQNSATAEESAAASQEMSGQSLILEEMISRFKLKAANIALTEKAVAAQNTQAKDTEIVDKMTKTTNFGKY